MKYHVYYGYGSSIDQSANWDFKSFATLSEAKAFAAEREQSLRVEYGRVVIVKGTIVSDEDEASVKARHESRPVAGVRAPIWKGTTPTAVELFS